MWHVFVASMLPMLPVPSAGKDVVLRQKLYRMANHTFFCNLNHVINFNKSGTGAVQYIEYISPDSSNFIIIHYLRGYLRLTYFEQVTFLTLVEKWIRHKFLIYTYDVTGRNKLKDSNIKIKICILFHFSLQFYAYSCFRL
jgi:hypothetical protein